MGRVYPQAEENGMSEGNAKFCVLFIEYNMPVGESYKPKNYINILKCEATPDDQDLLLTMVRDH